MIASLALLRVHVLVVELPGRPLLRLRADAAVRARGWVPVAEPADADLVLVCGAPPADLAAAVDALWSRVQAPRVRRTVAGAEALAEALDSAARVLADGALQRRSAAVGAAPVPARPGDAKRLVLRLGPVAPGWPAGLVLDCAVGPDGRLVAADLRRLGVAADPATAPELALLLAVAHAARVLRLAAWPTPALRLEHVVDLALAGTPRDRVRRRLRSVAAQVRRSATFRWAAGDVVRDRVLALLGAAIDGRLPPPPADRALVGARLETVPLLVAATEPVGG